MMKRTEQRTPMMTEGGRAENLALSPYFTDSFWKCPRRTDAQILADCEGQMDKFIAELSEAKSAAGRSFLRSQISWEARYVRIARYYFRIQRPRIVVIDEPRALVELAPSFSMVITAMEMVDGRQCLPEVDGDLMGKVAMVERGAGAV